MLSQLESDQGTTTTIFFVPNSIQKYRGATVPQITIGAKEKWQPYFADLSIIISVRYHTQTHTPKHKTHTRLCAINTKRKKIKKVKDVIVNKQTTKKKKTGSHRNYGVKIPYIF